jgi:hypothetical protein
MNCGKDAQSNLDAHDERTHHYEDLPVRKGVLDSEGRSEMIGREKLRRMGPASYPVKSDPEIGRTQNANSYPMQRVKPRVISRRRGCRG